MRKYYNIITSIIFSLKCQFYRYLGCDGLIPGCATCEFSDARKTTVVCSACRDGYYLMKNETLRTDIFPAKFTFCVTDCNQAHYAYVNNPATGECVHCGNHSLSCNLRYGSEICDGDG